ncbi:MAG: stage sporulation protein [Clostridiaceae bacterium]|jgi:replication-associated recombination protein RarA|nr:stage sporulation protein [Clostridiaceae bacterium]
MIEDISKKFIRIEKNLNNELVGQESYINKLSNYFKGKFISNEKGTLFLAGEKNTAKKTSIKLLFQELKREKLVDKSEIEELDLGAYNFNLGFNAFLTDLYEKLNSDSECLLFRNIHEASEDMLNVLIDVYPNSCINLKEDYILKDKFLVEADTIYDNKISKFICHDKFFIFTFNNVNLDELIDNNFKEKADAILLTRNLDHNEMKIVLKKEILKIFKKIEEELKLNVSLQIIEENQLKEDLGLSNFLEENYRNDCNFGIEKYISYEIYKPIENLIRKQELKAGEKILIYAENNEIHCKTGSNIFKLNDYSTPTLEEAKYKLNSIIGMKELKEFINNIENNYKVQKIREKLGLKTSNVVMNMIFAGNAGTGKTNAARVTFEYLNALGVLASGVFKEVSKADFVSENSNDTAKRTNDIINSALGGVLFIDEAYSLCESEDDKQGKEIVDALLKGFEDNRNNLIVIMAGYERDMDVFLSINPGLKSRFPNIIHFEDYNPSEMYAIAKDIAKSKGYRISDNVKSGLIDLFIRNQIVDKNDLGNARFVRNIVENAIMDASKKYLTNVKKEIDLLERDNFNFKVKTKFDLEEKLNEIIGLEDVKKLLRSQYKIIAADEKRKSAGVNTKIEQNLNMVFAGNPGTGKTSIARLVADMLNSMGILKVGQLIETDRSSFVSEIPGETSKKTEAKFREAIGGILFIDEAYTLANDSLGREAIETLLKLIEDYSREVIVILAGYEKDMEDFFDVNIGLRSRFPLWTNFQDYNADELFEMSIKLIEAKGFKLSKNAFASLKKSFVDIYENSDAQSGNGRMVRNYVEKLIRNQSIRISENDISVYEMNLITTKDIEKISVYEYDSKFDLEESLKTLKVNEKAKDFLRNQYSVMKAESKRRKFGIRIDINKNMNMIFTGEIGTGKRAVLNLLAEMYYDMGIIKAKGISELDGNEIIYMIGKGMKIEDILNKLIGKIVYIDNASVIMKDERYKDIEISLIKFIDNNRGKIIITIAGEFREMKELILSDPSLNSRFPLWLDFDNYSLEELVDFALHILNNKGFIIDKNGVNAITNVLKDIYKNNNMSLKNGLMVESFADTLVRTQSIRVCNENAGQKEINIIITGDIIAAKEAFLKRNIN